MSRAMVLVDVDEESGVASFTVRRFGHPTRELVADVDGSVSSEDDPPGEPMPRTAFELARWLVRR